jgi:hypothetical protein
LLIEGFANTIKYPIVIENNIFKNNFAYHFAPSFVITKNENDFINLDCNGIFISGNTFNNNLGCNHAFGNVIVSCEPNNPNVVSVNSDTSTSQLTNERIRYATTFSTYYT